MRREACPWSRPGRTSVWLYLLLASLVQLAAAGCLQAGAGPASGPVTAVPALVSEGSAQPPAPPEATATATESQASESAVPAASATPTPGLAATPDLPTSAPTATPSPVPHPSTPTPIAKPSPGPTSPPTVAPRSGPSATPAPGPPTPTRPAGSLTPASLTADVGLDPGHSRMDVGATGGGLREHELTLDIALRARRILEARDVKVALSRTDADPVSAWSAADLTDRTRIEQEARIRAVGRVRAYVSVHLNAFSSPSLAGTETYYNADNQGAESRRLAAALQAGVVRRLAEAGYAPRDRGVREDLAAGKPYGHFFSLRGGVPSALVEALFLSNPTEAALLSKESTREAIARGVADGVLAYLSPN